MTWKAAITSLIVLCLGLCPRLAQARIYDALSDRTLAREAIDSQGQSQLEMGQGLYLLDGSIRSQSTGQITFDRSVHSLTRARSLIPFQAGLRGKLLIDTQHIYRKQEGAALPRRIVESKKQESQARAELSLSSTIGLSYLIGFQAFILPAYTQAFRAEGLRGDDRYAAFQKFRNYFAILQQQGSLQAGILYEAVLDEAREVERSNSLEETVVSFDDQVYHPARINLFARTPISLGSLYTELSLLEASGGGARNSVYGTLYEDSFRLQLAWTVPIGGKDSSLETALSYQSMAYADRQAVSFETMPLTSLHSKVRWQAALPLYAGVNYFRGHDTQSFAEFNTHYLIWGLGAELGTLWTF